MGKTALANEGARRRWSAAARVLAGTLGAYGMTVIATVALSKALIRFGVSSVEAVTGATLASYALFAVVSMAVFHAHSVARTWLWLAVSAAPLALAARLL